MSHPTRLFVGNEHPIMWLKDVQVVRLLKSKQYHSPKLKGS